MSLVQLKVNNQLFTGWEQVRIERGIEQIAGSFELQVSDRWADLDAAKRIQPGSSCVVMVSGSALITGYIDSVSSDINATTHSVKVSGRDKTGDLVDCSAIYKTGQWINKKIEEIAGNLLQPFGIQLSVDTATGTPLPSFSIQEGESVFEALERAARMKAVLLLSDGNGGLIITRAGTTRKAPSALVEGANLLSASSEFNWKDRFSDYTIKGQMPGNDQNYGQSVAHQSGSINDASITRYRPLIVLAEDQDSTASLKQRAEWERNVRAGRGTRATATVQGWEVNGQLWRPNSLVRFRAPSLGADLDLLIVSVAFSLDDSGTLTELQLARPEAFSLLENVKQTRLDKAIRKPQGDESGITQPEWEWKL